MTGSWQDAARRGSTPSAEIDVFLGIHGDRWVDNAIASVENQQVSPLKVAVAINGPTPLAEERVLRWQAASRHHVRIAVNDRNLGPLGSWYTNRGLLTSPWVAILHQDDVYLPNHIATLMAAAEAAPEDVFAIFTAMEGITVEGAPKAAPPLRNRHLDLAPSVTTVPEILRRHPFPTPASAIRNPGGYVDGLAWYDSGAPDSEWFAHLACRGRFRILSEVTVQYRQPETSESSQTGWESRAWQWAQSLNRFIQSEDFGSFLRTLTISQRVTVAQETLNAIPARYPTSPAFAFLQFAAAQRMAEVWGYAPGPATALVQQFLAACGESAATRSLDSIVGGCGHGTPEVAEIGTLLGVAPEAGPVDRWGRRLYKRHGHRLPRWAQEAAFGAYDRLRPRRGAQ